MLLIDYSKILAFHILSASYKLTKEITPVRKRVIPYLKRANQWVAKYDMRRGRGPIRNYPVNVTLQATYRCNLSCPMCFRQTVMAESFPKLNTLEIPIEDFTKIADQLFPYAYTVNLSIAGEPFLYTILDQILPLLDKYQCKIEAYSNMTPLTNEKLMDKVLPHMALLTASIDGATPETFEKIRKGAKFNAVVKALEQFGTKRKAYLPDNCPTFALNVTIQQDNVRELPDLVRLAKRVGADYICGDHIVTYDDPELMKTSMVQDMDTYILYYEEAVKIGQEIGIEVRLRPPVYENKEEETSKLIQNSNQPVRMECPFLWRQVVINPNGNTYACCHPEPPLYGPDGINDFWSVWDSPEARKLRSQLQSDETHPSCRNCWIKYPVKD